MAFAETGSEGALNGATAVTIVAAPASGRHVVKGVNIYNADTAAVTVTIRKNKGGVFTILKKETLQVAEDLTFDKTVVLDAVNESLEALLSGAAATTNPDYETAYAVVT